MLVQQAIERAYREAAIKRIGDVPTVDEYNEGLDRLNGFLDSLFGAEIGELLTDWQVPSLQRTTSNSTSPITLPFPQNLTPFDQPYAPSEDMGNESVILPPNVRVLWRGTTPTRVYLPQNPGDGARIAVVDTGATATLTLDGNGRRINGANTADRIQGLEPITYFYRADLAEWRPIASLSLTDSLPLPSEFDRLVICGTAISLTGLDEITPTTGTMFMYNRLLKRCQQRYYQRGLTTYGGQNLEPSIQAYDFAQDRLW